MGAQGGGLTDNGSCLRGTPLSPPPGVQGGGLTDNGSCLRGCPSVPHWGRRGGGLTDNGSCLRGAPHALDKKEEVPDRFYPVRDFRITAATYSPNWWVSTIGADELNGSVRDGKRWILIALTTALYHLRDYLLGLIPVSERYRAISTGRLCHRWLYTSRLSTS